MDCFAVGVYYNGQMGKKRRTKKDKVNPRHPTSYSWKSSSNEAKHADSEANVKRQLSKSKAKSVSGNDTKKQARHTDKNALLASVKKDLTKSLLFATLIVASEVVIYLIWY